MKNVLFIFPTTWDRRQLEACRATWRDRYAVRFAGPADEDCPADYDVLGFIDRTTRQAEVRPDGVASSSDYPGAAAAAAVATGMGLPGSRPESVLLCSHKYYARLAELGPAPEALPAFALVDPETPHAPLHWIQPRGRSLETPFPCFVKPVKGAFSVMSACVEHPAALAAFLSRPQVHEYTRHYLRLFEQLLHRFSVWEHGARMFLAEELLVGDQVTVEGFVAGGQVEILGIVDSVMHPGTRSFQRFDYPSGLDAAIQARMTDIVRRIVPSLGLDWTLFNVELIHDPTTGRVSILEVNPRMCGQFADLYEKVDGTNSYEVALQIATGERPVLRRGGGAHRVAASYPLRVFEPSRVEHVPSPADVQAAEALFPGTLVWVECEAGQRLCDFESFEDGASARYAVINLGAPDRASLQARFEAVQTRLGFRIERLAAASIVQPSLQSAVPTPA